MKLLGQDLTPGTNIQVGVFDGWGAGRIYEWSGHVNYTEGRYSFKNGVIQSYDSISNPAPASTTGQMKYYFTAPTYERYIPNGGFII